MIRVPGVLACHMLGMVGVGRVDGFGRVVVVVSRFSGAGSGVGVPVLLIVEAAAVVVAARGVTRSIGARVVLRLVMVAVVVLNETHLRSASCSDVHADCKLAKLFRTHARQASVWPPCFHLHHETFYSIFYSKQLLLVSTTRCGVCKKGRTAPGNIKLADKRNRNMLATMVCLSWPPWSASRGHL